MLLGRGWQTFPEKGHIVSSSGFADYVVSVASAQLCLYRVSSHRPEEGKCLWLCSNKTVFVKTTSGWCGPKGHSLQISDVGHRRLWEGVYVLPRGLRKYYDLIVFLKTIIL